MKKIFLMILSLIFLPTSLFAKVNVVATLPTFAALAEEVGKGLVDVKSLARGDQDPHFLEPKPSYAVLLNKADLVLEDGLELEVGWLPVLLTQSRNPKIQVGQKGHLNLSEGIPVLEVPSGKVDRSEGDVHPLGNPHYWLDPRNALIMSRNIANRLKELDPAHSTQYEENFLAFQSRLQSKIQSWDQKLKSYRAKKMVTYHRSLSYFSNWSGIEVAAYVEPKPGISPSPNHLLSLISLIQTQKIPVIVSENYYDMKPSQQLSEKSKTKLVLVSSSVGGSPTIKTYEDLIEDLVQKITGAL
ncbi:MAG: zinc ABC transporter substrate-binding protein [Deltaproteobacteria bacterium]|nr:zinc ABC transporter substrate-binding protein [Deltaproteobacteria bacterium]